MSEQLQLHLESPTIGCNSSASLACPSHVSLLVLALIHNWLAQEEVHDPLAHPDRMNAPMGNDLLDRPAATNRVHGVPGLEPRVGCCIVSTVGPPVRGRGPASGVHDKSVQEDQPSSGPHAVFAVLSEPI